MGLAMRTHHGFTLIELMIVVAIVAILAAIALPAYRHYLIRAQVSEGLHVANGAGTAVWEYAANHGALPTDNPSAGLPDKEELTGRYVQQVEITAAGILVTYGKEANEAIMGDTLILQPTLTSSLGALAWVCTGGTLGPNYRPTSCR